MSEKRTAISYRLTVPLREKLEVARKAHGCSLTEEITRRIDQTFERDNLEKMIRRVLAEQREEALMSRYAEEVSGL